MPAPLTSHYPGIHSVDEFRRLWQDPSYQDALSTNGRITRTSIQNSAQGDRFESSWQSTVHRTLDQGHLRVFKRFYPDGLDVRWRESHSYSPTGGTMRIDMENPIDASIVADVAFIQNGDTLERHLHFDLDNVHIPGLLGWVPGVSSKVVTEITKGLVHADERTQTWLSAHAAPSAIPTAAPAPSTTPPTPIQNG